MHILASIDAGQSNRHTIAIKQTAFTGIIQRMSQIFRLESLYSSHTAEWRFVIESMALCRQKCLLPTLSVCIHIILISQIVRSHGIRQQGGIALEDAVDTHKSIDVITIGTSTPYLGSLLHGKAKELLQALAHQGTSYIEDKIGHITLVIPHLIQHFIEIGNQEIAREIPACRIFARCSQSGWLN